MAIASANEENNGMDYVVRDLLHKIHYLSSYVQKEVRFTDQTYSSNRMWNNQLHIYGIYETLSATG
jgi:hypothetical protein